MERSPKPRRSLSAYNLFYRFKRFKTLKAHDKTGRAASGSKEAVRRLIEAPPGLEDYPSIVGIMPVEKLQKIRRGEIRSAMAENLMPADNDGRRHRKSHNSCVLSFVEMNEVVGSSWKAIDDFGRSVFEELAQEGREKYRRLVVKSRGEVEVSQFTQEETKSNNPIAAPEKTRSQLPTDGSSSLLSPAAALEYREKDMAITTVETEPTSPSVSTATPQKTKLLPLSPNKITSYRELLAKQEGRSTPEEMTMATKLHTALEAKGFDSLSPSGVTESITSRPGAMSSTAHGAYSGHTTATFPSSNAVASGPKEPGDTSPPKSTEEPKPKRALTAYNLFFRYKRGKILAALDNNPRCSGESIIKLIGALPGLEDYPSIAGIIPPEHAKELRRVEISTALAGDSLSPNRVKNRDHKMVKGPVGFIEVNKAISASWKEIDDFSKSVLENLAEEGRRMRQNRVTELEGTPAAAEDIDEERRRMRRKRVAALEGTPAATKIRAGPAPVDASASVPSGPEGRRMRQKRVAGIEGTPAATKLRASPTPVDASALVPSRPEAAKNGHAGHPLKPLRVPCDAAVHEVKPATKKLRTARLHEPASPVCINPFNSGPSRSRASENGHFGYPAKGMPQSRDIDIKVEPKPLAFSNRVRERASPVLTNPFNSSPLGLQTPENDHSECPLSVELPQPPDRISARGTARGGNPADLSPATASLTSISDYLNNTNLVVEPEPLTFSAGFAELAEPSSDADISFDDLSFDPLSFDALITDCSDAASSSTSMELTGHGGARHRRKAVA